MVNQEDNSHFITVLDGYYNDIGNCSRREKSDKLYAIIGIKGQNRELRNYVQTVYKDIKQFITSYLELYETEDYGYDIPNKKKLIEAINTTENIKEQLSLLCYTRLFYDKYGYDSFFLEKLINRKKMRIDFQEKKYVSFLLKLSAYNLGSLLLSYVVFLLILYVIILPAPFTWMSLFDIQLYDFCQSPFINRVMNTIAIVIGGDYSPIIIPKGLMGLMVIVIGKVFFYLLVGNFIVKKISDIITLE